jgi:hypothetical protein
MYRACLRGLPFRRGRERAIGVSHRSLEKRPCALRKTRFERADQPAMEGVAARPVSHGREARRGPMTDLKQRRPHRHRVEPLAGGAPNRSRESPSSLALIAGWHGRYLTLVAKCTFALDQYSLARRTLAPLSNGADGFSAMRTAGAARKDRKISARSDIAVLTHNA